MRVIFLPWTYMLTKKLCLGWSKKFGSNLFLYPTEAPSEKRHLIGIASNLLEFLGWRYDHLMGSVMDEVEVKVRVNSQKRTRTSTRNTGTEFLCDKCVVKCLIASPFGNRYPFGSQILRSSRDLCEGQEHLVFSFVIVVSVIKATSRVQK